jgi:type VI secretion system protein VasG
MLHTAAEFCITRTNREVSIEHLLLKCLEDGDGDIPLILSHYDINKGEVWEGLNRTLEGFSSGASGNPRWSPTLLELIESAWVSITLHHQQNRIRTGAIFEVMLDMDSYRLGEYMDTLADIPRDQLRKNFKDIVAGSVEESQASSLSARPTASRTGKEGEVLPQQEGETALERFTLDVTGRARAGDIDPAHGRDEEMRQIIDILSRRRKNNPILVGEAGVGKTHVVEGLALRIVQGDVPEVLKEVEIRGLDMGLLQAGAGVKGEFENRLKTVIKEVKEAPKPTVLFIDEAHLLTGTGSAGSGDAANLLKPELARGELRTIASTTFSEYKRYIEKDPALARRFQPVQIDEPSEENACLMLRATKGKFESHHDIQISNDAVTAAVKLAARYISGRQLPDKAVDLMDTSAARVKMAQSAKPAKLDDAERKLNDLNIEIAAIQKDLELGVMADRDYLAELEEQRQNLEEDQKRLHEQWIQELEVVKKISDLQRQLTQLLDNEENDEGSEENMEEALEEASEDGANESEEDGENDAEEADVDPDSLRAELQNLREQLWEIQGDEPLVHVDVDGRIAAQVVSDWTGIPVGNMMKDEADVLLNLEKMVEERIRGQSHAVKEIADTIRASKAGVGNPEAPIGVFLLVGPSGVGKTECSRVLADLLFGGERFMTTINMSEYQESHTVSQLKGAPPGYVGYGEGGILTEAVRHRPYNVVVLDEVEKAHRDVLNLFYQVFDRGFMRDGEGREIDFKNTVIMMTGNLGWETIFQMCSAALEGDEMPEPELLIEAIHPELQDHFGAALLARCKVIPFYPLDTETMKGIVKIKLEKIGRRLMESHKMGFQYTPELVDRIAERCTQVESGARNIDYIINKSILPDISSSLLMQMAEEEMPGKLIMDIDESGDFHYRFE